MAQEQVSRWPIKGESKETPVNDSLSRWPIKGETKRIKSEETLTEPITEEESITPPAEESPGMLSSFWDAITKSALPESKSREYTPETLPPFFDRAIDEVGRGVYEDVIRPTASGLGAAATVFGGPIARGALKVASKIPGAAKLGSALIKERSLFSKPVGSAVDDVAPVVDDIAKVSTPEVTPAVIPPGATPEVIPPKPSIAKLHQALDESKPLTEEQAAIYTKERAKKFGEARDIDIVDQESGNKFLSKFAGEHTKVTREPLKLDQPDVDDLTSMIGDALKADVIDTPSSARAIVALRKLLEGGVPQPSEIEVLEKIFGAGLIERLPTDQTLRQLVLRTVSIPKAIVSALDIGIPFRQGINRVGQKEWFGMLKPSISSYWSENSYNQWINAIKTEPLYDLMKKSGLPLGELVGTGREEQVLATVLGKNIRPYGGAVGRFVNRVADNIGNAPGIRHSNRAYAVGAAKLRADLFKSQYKDYKRIYETTKRLAGKDKELLDSAEFLNPDNLRNAKRMSDAIAISTGRGNLGRLEPIAEELNATLFAPRLMSARFRTIGRLLNPKSYMEQDPIRRKDALKQLISITGTALSSAAMFKSAGGEVELDPRSSDFLKGKIGKTRFDMGGGYLQYMVPMAKIMSAAGQEMGMPIDHSAKSTRTGEGYNLGDSPVGQDKWETFESFFTNKASPLASLFIAFMRGVEPSGKEVDFTSASPFENTALKTFMPFMIQDFKELLEEDPTLLPLMAPGWLGANIQVHNDRERSGRR